MDIRKLQRLVIDALEDVKAQDIVVYNTTTLSDLFDRVVLAIGTSNRHTRSVAGHVADKVREAGGHVISVEGEDGGEWVLVDLGDVVVHVMLPVTREHYALEEIWGGKTVRVKLGAGTSVPTPRSMARAAPGAAPARTTTRTARGS